MMSLALKMGALQPLQPKVPGSSSGGGGDGLSSSVLRSDALPTGDASPGRGDCGGRGVTAQLLAGDSLVLKSRSPEVSTRPASEPGPGSSASASHASPTRASAGVLSTTRNSPSAGEPWQASTTSQPDSSSLSSGVSAGTGAFLSSGAGCCFIWSTTPCGGTAAVRDGDAEVEVVPTELERRIPQTMARNGCGSAGVQSHR
mmetsp:Transcript_58675/g.164637  ORF Transcript_58675/g.164637 Transcript_58675/m.164637 type:complete len:201 (-) Transcript_58675:34-636(-)